MTTARSRLVTIAHRGLVSGFPENTLAAFRQCADAGIDGVEFDLRATADGEIVVLHDETVDRTTDGSGAIREISWAEARRLDAGCHAGERFRGETIPRLDEVLTLLAGRSTLLVLDLKAGADLDVRQIAAAVHKAGVAATTVIGANTIEELRAVGALGGQIRRLGFVPTPAAIDDYIDAGADIIRLMAEWVIDGGRPTPEAAAWVRRCHDRQTPVWCVVHDVDGRTLDLLSHLGVAGIITDAADDISLPAILLDPLARLGRALVFGHRGATASAIENTEDALRAALASRADGVEVDVRLTRDRVAVLAHDPDLRRVAGVEASIAARTCAELQADFPALLRLDDALEVLRHRPVVLDVKVRSTPDLEVVFGAAARHGHPGLMVTVYNEVMTDAAAAFCPNRPRVGLLDDEAAVRHFIETGGEWLRLWGTRDLTAADLATVRRRGPRVLIVAGHGGYPATQGRDVIDGIMALRPDAVFLDDPAAAYGRSGSCA